MLCTLLTGFTATTLKDSMILLLLLLDVCKLLFTAISSTYTSPKVSKTKSYFILVTNFLSVHFYDFCDLSKKKHEMNTLL